MGRRGCVKTSNRSKGKKKKRTRMERKGKKEYEEKGYF